jgi:hypothetical protein
MLSEDLKGNCCGLIVLLSHCIEGLGKTQYVMIAGVAARDQTEHLPNTS